MITLRTRGDYRWRRDRRAFRPVKHGPIIQVGRRRRDQEVKGTRPPRAKEVGFR